MAEVYLTHKTISTSTTYQVHCTSIDIGWRNNIFSKPKANGGEVVEVQTQSFENPVISLKNVHLIEGSTATREFITYDNLVTLAKVKNTDTEYLLLTVKTFDKWINASAAEPSTAVLADSAGVRSGIKVAIDSFKFSLNLDSFVYSSDDVVPGSFRKERAMIGDIILRESA